MAISRRKRVRMTTSYLGRYLITYLSRYLVPNYTVVLVCSGFQFDKGGRDSLANQAQLWVGLAAPQAASPPVFASDVKPLEVKMIHVDAHRWR